MYTTGSARAGAQAASGAAARRRRAVRWPGGGKEMYPLLFGVFGLKVLGCLEF